MKKNNLILGGLCCLLLASCGQEQAEESTLKGISVTIDDACLVEFWPEKEERFNPVRRALDLFECMGTQLNHQLQAKDLHVTAYFKGTGNFSSHKTPSSRQLFSVGVVEPCYVQQINKILSTPGMTALLLLDTLADCIVNASYEQWKNDIFHLQANIIGESNFFSVPLPVTMVEPCILQYREQSSPGQDARHRIQLLKNCLVETLDKDLLIKQSKNFGPVISQEENTISPEEEQEVIDGELPVEQDDSSTKVVDVIEDCVEIQRQQSDDSTRQTEELIDCSVDALYKELRGWSASLKAHLLVFTNRNVLKEHFNAEFDVVIPLWHDDENRQMMAMQPGFILSVYAPGNVSIQGSMGMIYRLFIMDDILGFNILYDVRLIGEGNTHRLSIGADYQIGKNTFSLNYYPPLAEWIDLYQFNEIKQSHGIDLGFSRFLSKKLYLNANISLWGGKDKEALTFWEGSLGYRLNCTSTVEAGILYGPEENNLSGRVNLNVQMDPYSRFLRPENCYDKNASPDLQKRIKRATSFP